MKSSGWLALGAVAAFGVYLYVTNAANKISFVLQNVGFGQNGLLTQLITTFLITNATTSSITLTNVLITVQYNGAAIGSGLTPSVILNPGQNSIPFTLNLSDITLLGDVTGIVNSQGSAPIQISIVGTGRVNGFPISFTQAYQF